MWKRVTVSLLAIAVAVTPTWAQVPAAPTFEQLAAQVRDAAYAKGWRSTLDPLVRLRDDGTPPERVQLRLGDALYPNARIVRINNPAAIDGNGALVMQTYNDDIEDTWEGVAWWTDGTWTGGSLLQVRFNQAAFDAAFDSGELSDDALEVVYSQQIFWQQTGPEPGPQPPGTVVKRAKPAPDWNTVLKCVAKMCFATGIAALVLSRWLPIGKFFMGGCTAQAINCALGQIWDILDPPKPPGSCLPDWLGRIRC